MKWHLIQTGENTGRYNMDYDLNLAYTCKSNEAYFRLYKWKPYCISLGANQKFEDIDHIKAEKNGIDVVKRPTGGRAILHAEEITYSVITPYSESWTAREIYKKVSLALIKGLEYYHPMLAVAELENLQPNFPKLLEQPSGVLCFGSTAKNEVKFKGKKLIGSAQRKLNSIMLQHGSILCGSYHRNIVKYLIADDNTKNNLSKELLDKTTEINALLNEQVDYKRLLLCFVNGFEDVLNIKFEEKIIPFQSK